MLFQNRYLYCQNRHLSGVLGLNNFKIDNRNVKKDIFMLYLALLKNLIQYVIA